jgi:hypothetical protein
MSDLELKPCPFCQSAAAIDGENGRYWVECTGCYIMTARYVRKDSAAEIWNRRPAPQAQEETRGAPAPKVLHLGNSMELRNLAKVAGTLAAPQPPAPASPAGPWAEYTKAPVPDLNHVYWLVWAARHMVAVCAGRDADIATVSDQAKLLGVLLAKHFANIPDVVGSKAITPAAPEAGAPGTQGAA